MKTSDFNYCNTKAQRYIKDIRNEVEKTINLKLNGLDPNVDQENFRYKLIDNNRTSSALKELDSLGADSFIYDTHKEKYIGTLDYKLISNYQEITLELYQYNSCYKGTTIVAGWTLDTNKVTDIIAYIGYVEGVRTVFLVDYYDLRNYISRNIEHYLNLATQQTIERNIRYDNRSKTKTKHIKYSLKIDSKMFNDILKNCNGISYSQGICIDYDDKKDSLYNRLKKQMKKEDRIKVSKL